MANLEFRYGPMNSGKSMALLQMAYNYEENNKKVILIKSVIDTKGGDYLVSRIGPKRKIQIKLDKKESLLSDEYMERFKKNDAILVDEAQFLTKSQVEYLWIISKKLDIPVICFGLKTNFKSEFFEGSKRLFELSDKFKKLETICKCGKKATQNLRLKNNEPIFDGEQLLIDESTEDYTYESVCGKCYLELKKAKESNGRKNNN